jgi:hypothetical protein
VRCVCHTGICSMHDANHNNTKTLGIPHIRHASEGRNLAAGRTVSD